MSALRLNLGCAGDLRPGWTNVDIVPGEGVTVADLRETWPWDDSSVREIAASHVIEHLPDKIHTMNELWRVLMPGGIARIDVPTTDGPAAWQDPTHVSYWNLRSFMYYLEGDPYHEAYARRYGIHARFSMLRRAIEETIDGPILHIDLGAVKAP